mmetsp:Transcript_26522/g.39397  ORF Transcript_26522/g.39397 Transcript_26522/m.39397 type:complete len:1304 (-) Transcript_26522:111-4022(-)|eukprot:CAMPEP_0185036174 /NCGR_PEP_ID=MMETSP1103-20130426/28743_1 /TAXON_ID=36769 /ORGANISM="Paraphysomonas bandaiensis, Strain Caron Lab Isolate" /LENGTH=1303 /DNA_ID=CAMNT_0027573605 /DNA_START=44 /DNA_END=3955 /DNA_ORIENTATION=-
MSGNSAALAMFQKNLQDIVKGIRSQKRDPSSFISQSIAEIKAELQSTDPFIKAEAVRKLTYLHSMGYNVSWASFSIVEVMSQPRFDHKRIGYLAANQSFSESTDVILLTTNLFKKEFAAQSSRSHYEIGLAINCLSNIANKDLARDCMSDVVALMSHSRPYIRKKAVTCMYKLYVKYPQGLRLTFDSLKEKLDDPDSSVVSCAVNVICELARKNPRNYLAMAPKFFKLLTTSSNNWMLIKVVKLMGSLVCEEPRLARKLLEPLATIIQNNSAKSLQYECIHTITLALPFTRREDGSDARNVPAVLALCAQQLHELVEDEDQNLKYLGLVGLKQLMASHPRVVVEQRELVLMCLADDDVTIRTKALELLVGIVTKKTLVDLVHHLLKHVRLAEGAYRDEIIAKILYMTGQDRYALVTDFVWYVSVLQRLACMQSGAAGGVGGVHERPHHGKKVAEHLMDICLRVKSVRPYAVECMVTMLLDGGELILGQAKDTVAEVLMAAAWICGEYSDVLTCIMLDLKSSDEDEDEEEDDDEGYWIEGPDGDEIRSRWRKKPLLVMTVDSLLHPRATNLPPPVQSCFLHAAMKVFIRACDKQCDTEHLAQIVALMRIRLPVFLQSVHLEVQERASTLRHLLAEMGILSIGEEHSDHCDEDGSKQGDLLSFPVEGERGVDGVGEGVQVLPGDRAGATRAQGSVLGMLSAITNEQFFGVHPKAQRKVPVPEDLDLECAFNSKALTEVLNTGNGSGEKEPSLSTLSFISSSNSHSSGREGGSATQLREEDEHMSRSIESSFQERDRHKERTQGQYFDSSNAGEGVHDFGSNNGGRSVFDESDERDVDARDSTFYLRHQGDDERRELCAPFPTMDSETRRRKKKKRKEGSKSSKKNSKRVDRQDILPIGAEDGFSSEDEKGIFRTVKGKGKKASVTDNGADLDDENEGLENIDITTPLRADETLPVHRHREATGSTQQPSDRRGGGIEAGVIPSDEERKRQKAGKKKSRSKSKERKKEGNLVVRDLIGLDLETCADIGVDKNECSAAKAASPAQKMKKSKSKMWLPLHSEVSRFDVFYVLEYSAGNSVLSVTYRVINHPSHEFGISLSMGVAPQSATCFRLAGANGEDHSPVVRSVAPGNESQGSVEVEVAPGVLRTRTTHMLCHLQVTVESLLGPETLAPISVNLPIPVCTFFDPYPIAPAAFHDIIFPSTMDGRVLGEAHAKLKYSFSKPKKAFRAILAMLRGHEVEYEEGKAMTTASIAGGNRGGAQSIICTMLKASSTGKTVSVDVKCIGTLREECQVVANETVEALLAMEL